MYYISFERLPRQGGSRLGGDIGISIAGRARPAFWGGQSRISAITTKMESWLACFGRDERPFVLFLLTASSTE